MKALLEDIFLVFLNPNSRVYYPYLLAALLLAIIYFFSTYTNQGKSTFKGLIQFLFPKRIWGHQSAIIDYQIFVINNCFKLFLIVPYLMTHTEMMWIVVRFWNQLLGEQEQVFWSPLYINITYTIVYLLVADFSRFLWHYAFHKIPFLWQIHSVHHSAKVLTPITLYRVHPLEYFLFKLRSVLVFALVAGSFYYWFQTSIQLIVIFQIHIGIFLFNLLGANLRHSHIPISFGRYLEYLFISPAQHQIHHSDAKEHYDKNLGSLFAIWDWIFGSLLISDKQQKLSYGIDSKEQEKRQSLWQNIWHPIKDIFTK